MIRIGNKKTIYFPIMAFLLLIFASLLRVEKEKIVGIYFYPWYSYDGRHWNDTIEKPFIGFYDSRDENTIRWQLSLIKEAGIDFIIVSWWGPNSFEDEALKEIVRYIKDYDLKFAIIIEPYLGNRYDVYDETFWNNTLQYLKENFIEPYYDIYMKLYDKPLILTFNPVGMFYKPHFRFQEYTIRITGNGIDSVKHQDWDYWPDYIQVTNFNLKIRKDGMVSIVPRFCDSHFRKRYTCIDPDLSIGIYTKQWEWVLAHSEKIKIVILTSWNEYHERTQIEPSYYDDINESFLLYNLTKKYVYLFK